MLRKLLLILSLFFLIQVSTFAYSTSTGFASGECDYGRYGMRCGGPLLGSGGCPSNQRCVYQDTFFLEEVGTQRPNPFNPGGIYVGRCAPEYPCTDDRWAIGTVSESCGQRVSPTLGQCALGSRLEYLFSLGNYNYNGTTVQAPSFCGSAPDCHVLSNSILQVSAAYFKCVPDSTCSASECDYNATLGSPTGCSSGEVCDKVPTVDSTGNVTGFIGVCRPGNASTCEGASGVSAICSPESGCSAGQYCYSASTLPFTNDYCQAITSQNPASCFSTTKCGTKAAAGDSSWPSILVNKSLYCNDGLSCVKYNGTTLTKAAPGSYTSYASIDLGDCVQCVAGQGDDIEGASCGGLSVTNIANGEIDDCCNPDFKCGADNKCHRKPPTTALSFCSGQIPNPGSLCNAFGSTENYCDLCPLYVNGSNTTALTNGDVYCKDTTYADPQDTITCTDDCGCSTGKCNNGICVSNNSCISEGSQCDPLGSTPCCSSDSAFPNTCRDSLYAGGFTCSNTQCDQVKATLQCTEATESCCPDNKPFCNGGTCGEVFECEREGDCCPGYGMVCTDTGSSLACQASTDGACEVDDNVLPPAPAYLGPKIGIISDGQNQGLFSAIGAILYPAGIGIGLFFIVRAGYIIMMSEGSPDEVKKGQEYLTSAVIGTLFIVLSGSVLRIIINTLLG